MTYQRFEDLPVWQEAIRLAEDCEDFLIQAKDLISFSKRDQLDRCSLSISNNIAEGFERGTTNELLAFLYIARGSAGETRSMLAYFERRPALERFRPRIVRMKDRAESCSRQIRAWADSLQNSGVRGQRHLTQKTRNLESDKKRALAFERGLILTLAPTHPARVAYEKKNGPVD